MLQAFLILLPFLIIIGGIIAIQYFSPTVVAERKEKAAAKRKERLEAKQAAEAKAVETNATEQPQVDDADTSENKG